MKKICSQLLEKKTRVIWSILHQAVCVVSTCIFLGQTRFFFCWNKDGSSPTAALWIVRQARQSAPSDTIEDTYQGSRTPWAVSSGPQSAAGLLFFFFFFSPSNWPKSRTFVPKSTECYRDVNLILWHLPGEAIAATTKSESTKINSGWAMRLTSKVKNNQKSIAFHASSFKWEAGKTTFLATCDCIACLCSLPHCTLRQPGDFQVDK